MLQIALHRVDWCTGVDRDDRLEQIAITYAELGDFDAAIRASVMRLQALEDPARRDDPLCIEICDQLAVLYMEARRIRALPPPADGNAGTPAAADDRSVGIESKQNQVTTTAWSSSGGEDRRAWFDDQVQHLRQLMDKQRFGDVVAAGLRALTLIAADCGERHQSTARIHEILAFAFTEIGDQERALAHATVTLEIRQTAIGGDHPVAAAMAISAGSTNALAIPVLQFRCVAKRSPYGAGCLGRMRNRWLWISLTSRGFTWSPMSSRRRDVVTSRRWRSAGVVARSGMEKT
jgi:hypothetical protein